MRTTIPVMTAERLQSRISLWMLGAAQGNETLIDRIETTVAVLTVVGFDASIINELIHDAASVAGLDVKAATERFGVVVKEKTVSSGRGRPRKDAA